MSRGQEFRLGLVVAVARLLGVPVGVRDGVETETEARGVALQERRHKWKMFPSEVGTFFSIASPIALGSPGGQYCVLIFACNSNLVFAAHRPLNLHSTLPRLSTRRFGWTAPPWLMPGYSWT